MTIEYKGTSLEEEGAIHMHVYQDQTRSGNEFARKWPLRKIEDLLSRSSKTELSGNNYNINQRKIYIKMIKKRERQKMKNLLKDPTSSTERW